MRSPQLVIEVQLEAYSRRDIDAFAATYAPDIRIMDIEESLPPLIGTRYIFASRARALHRRCRLNSNGRPHTMHRGGSCSF